MTPEQAAAAYGYLTTNGRITGQGHEVEIWFAVADGVIYLLSGSGGRSDWCRNLDARPEATFTVQGASYRVRGRRVTDAVEDATARKIVFEKYQPGYGGDLVEWRDAAAPYALEVVDRV